MNQELRLLMDEFETNNRKLWKLIFFLHTKVPFKVPGFKTENKDWQARIDEYRILDQRDNELRAIFKENNIYIPKIVQQDWAYRESR